MKKTKKDVEVERLQQEIERLRRENNRLKEQSVVDSWAGQVDTMSGAHTQWEIENATAWR